MLINEKAKRWEKAMHAHRAYIQICQMMPIHAETLIHSLEYFRNDTYCKEEEKNTRLIWLLTQWIITSKPEPLAPGARLGYSFLRLLNRISVSSMHDACLSLPSACAGRFEMRSSHILFWWATRRDTKKAHALEEPRLMRKRNFFSE